MNSSCAKNNEIEKNGQTSGAKWYFIPLLASAYMAIGANMQGINALMPFIRDDFTLTRAQAGLYSSFYFLSATCIAVVSGRIVDRLGTRKGVLIAASSVGVMMLLHAMSPIYGIMLMLAFFTGFGFSLMTPSVSKGVMQNFPAERRAFSMGLAHSGGGVGGMLGAIILPLIGLHVGWRYALGGSAIFALAIVPFLFAFLRDSSLASVESGNDGKQSGESEKFLQGILALLKNRLLLCTCGFGIILGGALSSVSAHYALFLTRDLGIDPRIAGLGLATVLIGVIIGQPGWGWISDRFLRSDRRLTLFVFGLTGSTVCFLIGLSIGVVSPTYPALIVVSLMLGLLTIGGMALFFTTISELAGMERAGTAAGLSLIFTRTGVIFSPPLFGLISDLTNSYRYSWLALGGVMLTSAIAFFLVFGVISKRIKLAESDGANNHKTTNGA